MSSLVSSWEQAEASDPNSFELKELFSLSALTTQSSLVTLNPLIKLSWLSKLWTESMELKQSESSVKDPERDERFDKLDPSSDSSGIFSSLSPSPLFLIACSDSSFLQIQVCMSDLII